MQNSTQRFTSRVGNYVKYRPGYPTAILDLLRMECGLTNASVIADVGSGTGILTELFLKNGNPVFGVEPNREMRGAAELLLGNYTAFQSVPGAAEATTLPEHAIDLISVGQAFHWFDRDSAHREFLRILKPGGWVVLIWNDRNITSRPFFKAYEDLLLTYGTDYESVGHKHADAVVIASFFGTTGFKQAVFPNQQVLDFDGLKGRLLSSSYAPEEGHPKHVPMLNALDAIFRQHHANGQVTFEYDTTVYYGRLSS